MILWFCDSWVMPSGLSIIQSVLTTSLLSPHAEGFLKNRWDLLLHTSKGTKAVCKGWEMLCRVLRWMLGWKDIVLSTKHCSISHNCGRKSFFGLLGVFFISRMCLSFVSRRQMMMYCCNNECLANLVYETLLKGMTNQFWGKQDRSCSSQLWEM